MIPFLIGLAFGVIEWASAMEFYIMFLYEETTQTGFMAQFVLGPIQGLGDSASVGKATRDFGIYPGNEELNKHGWLIPWAVDAYSVFFWVAEYTTHSM